MVLSSLGRHVYIYNFEIIRQYRLDSIYKNKFRGCLRVYSHGSKKVPSNFGKCLLWIKFLVLHKILHKNIIVFQSVYFLFFIRSLPLSPPFHPTTFSQMARIIWLILGSFERDIFFNPETWISALLALLGLSDEEE